MHTVRFMTTMHALKLLFIQFYFLILNFFFFQPFWPEWQEEHIHIFDFFLFDPILKFYMSVSHIFACMVRQYIILTPLFLWFDGLSWAFIMSFIAWITFHGFNLSLFILLWLNTFPFPATWTCINLLFYHIYFNIF